MAQSKDISAREAQVYFLPVDTRVPLKFGSETVTCVTCARVRMRVADQSGRWAEGWGETPLGVQWVWPSSLSYEQRHAALKQFTLMLATSWQEFDQTGHPLEIGHAFQEQMLPSLLKKFNASGEQPEPMPWLAALVCCSAFDIALHDAYGCLHGLPIYDTYNAQYMNHDLSHYLVPAKDSTLSFRGKYPEDFLIKPAPRQLVAWHLVGGI